MISYFDLLELVKNGEAPRKIRVHLTINSSRDYEEVDDMDEFCYYELIGEPDDDYKYYLMESFIESCIFDENIEILEENKENIKKIETFDDYTAKGNLHTYMNINGNKCQVSEVQKVIINKLNKVIDYIKEKE